MKNNKIKTIGIRLTKQEYKRLMNEKPSYETISQFVRRILFYNNDGGLKDYKI